MLELRGTSLFVESAGEVRALLADISAAFPLGHFAAILGPSGSGKTTLLRLIAGIAQGEEEGEVVWNGRVLGGRTDFHPSEMGYVPQFSIAHEELTAWENVLFAMRLRVGGISEGQREEGARRALEETGLLDAAGLRAGLLSGGQKRRLALAMELVSSPTLLLADEVTSGLDPLAEDSILTVLRALSRHGRGRLVLHVTHSLRRLELYDSVAVLAGGCLAYHGPPQFLAHYFRCESADALYEQLEKREPRAWAASWNKHRLAFDFGHALSASPDQNAASPTAHANDLAPQDISLPSPPAPLPGAFAQFGALVLRRLLIFSRDPGQIFLHAGCMLGFPLAVAVFAWKGLPAVRNMTLGLEIGVVEALRENMEFLMQGSRIGSLVSGVVMFQVILLALMGANNAGREVAAERRILEKEKLAGLRPGSYLASKAAFLACLVLPQSLWMGVFVHMVCAFPGSLGEQLLFLTLANAAVAAVCLALSSWLPSPEQASLASIYLVGFQLPLSGAVLALPELLGHLVRPFVAAYWSWSGVLQTLRAERYYDIVRMVAQTELAPSPLALTVLILHMALGLSLAWAGCRRMAID